MNAALSLILSLTGLAQIKYPPRPAQGEFILDEAKILKDGDASEIRKVCGEVLAAKRAPIVVVTIKSMADYGATGWPIQRYAMNLFAEWAVGWADWNYGMLLLVSTGDRKARIELGASWGHLKDPEAQRIMNEEIVPRFKRGDFSGGIYAGVRGLREIATADVKGPAPPPQVYGPAPTKPEPRPNPGYSSAPVQPRRAPYQPLQRSHGLPDSGTNWGMIVLVIVIALVVLVVVFAVIKGGASSWSGSPMDGGGGGAMAPGCSAFAGGCLGSGMGGWFGGGRGYGYYDSPWDRPWGGGWFGGGHTTSHHYYHDDSGSSSSSGWSSDSSSSSSSSDSSSSGGGFSGGGGASGEW